MAQNPQLQIMLDHSTGNVLAAWTQAHSLISWLAEFAEVSLKDNHFMFWGRFTPGGSSHPTGRGALRYAGEDQPFSFDWEMPGGLSRVKITLMPRQAGTLVVLGHTGIPEKYPFWMEDFWFLSLENLRRYLDGKEVVRFDFSALKTGDVKHTIVINGPAERVFDALINPEQMNRWIAGDASVEPFAGGRYTYGWKVGGPFKILEIVPNEKLSHSWAAWEDEPASVITWTLEESGGKTRLTLVHSGFAPDQDSSGVQVGWLNFMNWIKSLVEYGQGWQPAITRIGPEMEGYYPASIVAAQGELVKTHPGVE